jgi:hypothetical protein
MAYLLFLLANAALFIRPAELVPSLGNVQVYLPLIAGAIVCAVHAIHNQLSLKTMLQQPINLCVVGVTAAVALSHITTGDLDGAARGTFEMTKVLLYYLLLVAVINTPLRLRQFLLTTAICSTVMVTLCLHDYFGFVEQWSGRNDLAEIKRQEQFLPPGAPKQLRHIPDLDGVTADGQEIWIFRLCGLGIFHDPNDLSLLIAVTAVIAGYFLLDRKIGPARWLWLAPLALMGVAYFYTFSRGGLLALGVAGMAWLATRFGGKAAIGLGVLAAAVVPLAMGRHADIDVSGGTGQHRIQIWSDGLVQLKSFRFFFGIGEGMYPDVAGLVAHNSYVHSFVELGFFGGMLFFGCFFFPAYAIYRIKRDGVPIEHPELTRMLPYIGAILAGWSMGMTSLSRCYVPPTYMVAGVCAAYLNLAGFHRRVPGPLQTFNRYSARRLVFSSAGLLACCFLFVKLFARWS